MPPKGFDEVPERYRSPLAITTEIDAWTYNTETYGGTCPVDNMWALTDAGWKGRVALSDPLLRADFLAWANQLQTHADDKVAAAYKDYFGKKIDTSSQSATEFSLGSAPREPCAAMYSRRGGPPASSAAVRASSTFASVAGSASKRGAR